jgi:peptide/nickel transport system substrate-binding protein
MTKTYTRRGFLGVGAMGAGALLVACTSSDADDATDTTTLSRAGTATTAAPTAPPGIEGGEVVTNPDGFPTRFNERPEFAAMVAAGTLPPVAERIGQDPLVIKPVHSIGKYGGTIRRAYIGPSDFQNPNNFCAGPDNLLFWDFRREHVVPNIALAYEMNAAGTELILHLRRGMRWSDGAPFTADDVVFWRDEINLNNEVANGAISLRSADGKPVAVQKVDDYTVRFTSSVPNPLLPGLLAGTRDLGLSSGGSFGDGGYAPKHYASQFHPNYTPLEQINQQAAAAGLEGWAAYLKNRMTWFLNPDLPVLTPWTVSRPINDAPFELTANPYSVWVDTDGNQLPYIGELSMGLAEQIDLITLRATAGELDFQDRHLQVASLPVLVENESRSGCKLHRSIGEELDFGVRINLAYNTDPVLGELLRNVDFRRALALGLDRDQINEVFFLGTSVPTATMCADFSPYFPGAEWRTKWATLDVAKANALLDGLGLTAKDGAGYRLRPDGAGPIRLDYQAVKAHADFPAVGEMIKGQWKAIGIDLNVAEIQGNLAIQRTVANELMLSGHQVGTSDPFLRADSFLPTITNNFPGMIGIPYAQWFASGGAQGTEPPASLHLQEGMDLYRRGLQANEAERIELGKQLYMLHADQVWSIGGVGFGTAVNGMYYSKTTMRNVPETAISSIHAKSPANLIPMTFYYE